MPGLPIANGVALAAKLSGSGHVVVVSFGDGATSQGATHEGLVMAVARKLPVVFVCENNDWSEMTPIPPIAPLRDLAERAPAYGMPGETVDGTDPRSVADAIAAAAERARGGGGPTFVECKTVRLMAHYHADIEHYRDPAEMEAAALRDPLPRLRQRLLADGTRGRAVARRARATPSQRGRTGSVGARPRRAAARPCDGERSRHAPVTPDGRGTPPPSAPSRR